MRSLIDLIDDAVDQYDRPSGRVGVIGAAWATGTANIERQAHLAEHGDRGTRDHLRTHSTVALDEHFAVNAGLDADETEAILDAVGDQVTHIAPLIRSTHLAVAVIERYGRQLPSNVVVSLANSRHLDVTGIAAVIEATAAAGDPLHTLRALRSVAATNWRPADTPNEFITQLGPATVAWLATKTDPAGAINVAPGSDAAAALAAKLAASPTPAHDRDPLTEALHQIRAGTHEDANETASRLAAYGTPQQRVTYALTVAGDPALAGPTRNHCLSHFSGNTLRNAAAAADNAATVAALCAADGAPTLLESTTLPYADIADELAALRPEAVAAQFHAVMYVQPLANALVAHMPLRHVGELPTETTLTAIDNLLGGDLEQWATAITLAADGPDITVGALADNVATLHANRRTVA